MRRYTIYNRLTAVAAGLCLCWLFMACGEDRGGDLPDDDPNHCVVTITLRTSRSVRPPQTKAGGMMTKADETTETDFWEYFILTDNLLVIRTGNQCNKIKNDSNHYSNERYPLTSCH